VIRDEATMQTEALREQLIDCSAFVPTIWHLEVAHVGCGEERTASIVLFTPFIDVFLIDAVGTASYAG